MNIFEFFKKLKGRNELSTYPQNNNCAQTQQSPPTTKTLREYFDTYPNPAPDPMHDRSVSTMGKIAECAPMFVRFVKSSDDAATRSLESWKRIPTEPNAISSVDINHYPMSMTSLTNALACIGYGDSVAYIPITPDIIEKYSLQDEMIWWAGAALDEYNARRFYVSDVKPLSDPETLMELIRTSNDERLKACLMQYYHTFPISSDVLQCLERQECFETAEFWKYLQKYFVEHVDRGEYILAARAVQENIDDLYEEWEQGRGETSIDDDFER